MGARLLPTVLGITLLTGCAAQDIETALPLDHPANPAAAVASVPPRSTTLRAEHVNSEKADSTSAPATAHDRGATARDSGVMEHNGGTGAHEQAGHDGAGDMADDARTDADAGDEHADHAAKAKVASKEPASAAGKADTMYVCPMHKEIKSDRPGKCPKCKMKLKAKKVAGSAASTGQPKDAAVAKPAAGGHEGHDAAEGSK